MKVFTLFSFVCCAAAMRVGPPLAVRGVVKPVMVTMRADSPELKAIKEALAEQVKDATSLAEKHGAASMEARQSWETVEELQRRISLENRLAPTLEEECALTEHGDADAECLELQASLAKLRALTATERTKSLEDLRSENAALKAKVLSLEDECRPPP